MKELSRRLIFGSISLVLVACFIYFSPLGWFRPILGIAVAAIACTALWEYYKLCEQKSFKPPIVFCISSAVFVLFVRYLQSQGMAGSNLAAWAIALVVFILFCDLLPRKENAIANLATSIFGILYIVIPLSLCFDILYTYPHGRWWLTLAIAVTVVTDAAGYIFGKLFGKHKLAPKLSPGKTIEGAVAAIICAMLTGWLWHAIMPYETILLHALILGLFLGIVGQVGDLCESLLKRDANIKDSNNIPGLGGALDVVDSLLFTLPLVYVFLKGVVQ